MTRPLGEPDLPSSLPARPELHRESDEIANGGEEPSLIEILNHLLRRWKLFAALPLIVATTLVLGSYLIRPTFRATAAFLPESGDQGSLGGALPSMLGQVTASLGLSQNEPSLLYADLIGRRDILLPSLLHHYADPRAARTSNDSASLLSILDVHGKSQAETIDRGLKALSELTAVEVDNATGIVSVSVDTHYPELSAAVANELVSQVSVFNQSKRQSTARARRVFIEGRVKAAQQDLTQAEQALTDFYYQNRSWQNSPMLTVMEARLRRQVDADQQLYLSLRQEYESARIDEVNDTPVISIVQEAVPPTTKAKPKRFFIALGGLGGGIVLAFLLVIGGVYMDRMRSVNPEASEELVSRVRVLAGILPFRRPRQSRSIQ